MYITRSDNTTGSGNQTVRSWSSPGLGHRPVMTNQVPGKAYSSPSRESSLVWVYHSLRTICRPTSYLLHTPWNRGTSIQCTCLGTGAWYIFHCTVTNYEVPWTPSCVAYLQEIQRFLCREIKILLAEISSSSRQLWNYSFNAQMPQALLGIMDHDGSSGWSPIVALCVLSDSLLILRCMAGNSEEENQCIYYISNGT